MLKPNLPGIDDEEGERVPQGLPLSIVLVSSFGAWLGAALVHQWFLK